MIKEHKDFESIEDNVVLWRYMSCRKFMKMLQSRALYFCRIDLFSDTMEGKPSPYDQSRLFPWLTKEDLERIRKQTFVSCWIEANNEQSMMWQLYAKDGVAIQTTVGRLRKSLEDYHDFPQYIGRVKYEDFQNDGSSHEPGQIVNLFRIAFTKRTEFSQEKEMRILLPDYDGDKSNDVGKNVPINIPALIEELVWSPLATDATKNEIGRMLEEQGLTLNIKESTLTKEKI